MPPPLSPLHQYIWQHRDDDPQRLALAKHGQFAPAVVAAQVAALQKLKRKVPTWYQPGLYFPAAISVEQASSERTAQLKAALFSGEKMADLTGGLGVDTFFFAQQFASAIHVEQNVELSRAVQQNFGQLGTTNVRFVCEPAESFLEKNTEPFDLLYLDPARRDGAGGRVFRLEDCQPDVLKIKDLLLRTAPRVLLKTAPLLDIRLAMEQLQVVSQVWVVAVDDECREVLYLLERQCPPIPEVPITAVHLLKDGTTQIFQTSFHEEQQSEATFAPPQQYLYEPNAAILKAGAFRSFAARYGLSKLHPNTHLYISSAYTTNVPARVFEIEAVCKYDRKSVQAFVPNGQANIATRNFPERPEQVRQRLGLREGGEVYLFAVTDVEGRKIVIGRKANGRG